MKNVILASILNINFVFIARLLQGASTTNIGISKIEEIEEKPCLSCKFAVIRFWFMCLILYKSILIADLFEPVSILLYLVYWIPSVWWFENFYNLRYSRAILFSGFAGKWATILAVWFEPHPLFWIPPGIFSFYCLYLASWYRYCLPH